jgi:TldD protein
VRVVVDGGWGYAATDRLTNDGVQACGRRGGGNRAGQRFDPHGAGASSRPEPPRQAIWSSTCAIDPFQVPLERKLASPLLASMRALRRVKGVSIAEGFMTFVAEAAVGS